MKKTLRWIVLVWSILAIPYLFDAIDFAELFFGALYTGLIIGIMIDDLRGK